MQKQRVEVCHRGTLGSAVRLMNQSRRGLSRFDSLDERRQRQLGRGLLRKSPADDSALAPYGDASDRAPASDVRIDRLSPLR